MVVNSIKECVLERLDMREILLDTETTGLEVSEGHKIIEIGMLEIINLVPSGQTLHLYINPERDIDEDAIKIHGITKEFVANKPNFKQVAKKILDFLADDKLVIHNAPFDLGFLNSELKQAGFEIISEDRVIDTLKIARQKFPGAQASLDALCRRFQIDNSHRDYHGALIDADLLASVYVELKGGPQSSLLFTETGGDSSTNIFEENTKENDSSFKKKKYRPARDYKLTEDEIKEHTEFLKFIKNPMWTRNG